MDTNCTVDLVPAVSTYPIVSSLQGGGVFGEQYTNNAIMFNMIDFSSYTGTVVIGNAAGTCSGSLSFSWTNVVGLNCLIYTNAFLYQQYGSGRFPLFFTNSTLQGNGWIFSTSGNNGYSYTGDITNSYAGCTFMPGTNSTSAGILNYRGSLQFCKSGGSNSVLKVKLTGTNAVAGIDHDRFAVNTTVDYLYGNIVSGSDPVNRLADCALVVDLSPLASGLSLTGKTNTILTCLNDLSSSHFASVQFLNGTGTVNYLNQKVTLTGVSTVPPVPRGTVVTLF